jgi:hypothetical protein
MKISDAMYIVMLLFVMVRWWRQRQWHLSSPSCTLDKAEREPPQGNPDGLRCAPALTRTPSLPKNILLGRRRKKRNHAMISDTQLDEVWGQVKSLHTLPLDASLLAPPFERVMPEVTDREAEVSQCVPVARYSEVSDMPTHNRLQPLADFRNRVMHTPPQLNLDSLQREPPNVDEWRRGHASV